MLVGGLVLTLVIGDMLGRGGVCVNRFDSSVFVYRLWVRSIRFITILRLCFCFRLFSRSSRFIIL